MKDSTRQKIESLKYEILSYYKNHSSRMTGLHFHINPAAIEEWIKEQNINKEPTVRVYPSEEELRALYLNQNKSKAEIAEMFDIAISTLSSLFQKYNIKKDSSQIVALRQQTCLEKYGVDNPRKADAVKDKIKETNQQRYGAITFTASEEGKSQIKESKLKHFGDSNYNNITKNHQTKQLRYGDKHYNNREKNTQTCMEKYGVKHGGLLPHVADMARKAACERRNYSETFSEIFGDRDKAIAFLQGKNYSMIDLIPLFNASYSTIQQWITRWDLKDYINLAEGKSQYEDQLVEYVKSLGVDNIETHNRVICQGQELDLYMPDNRVAIEFNGEYWHNNERMPPNYHYNKSIMCERQGIRLIHIYQHQWMDFAKQAILKSIIRNALSKNTNIIYARKCELKELTKKDVDLFSQMNSLHGHRNASIYLGLFYQGELVELMSFGKAFFSRDNSIDYECIRSITKINTTVVGGMNKLFKYFIHKWNPKKILYYVDYNTHNGNSMNKLGFEFINYSKHGVLNVSTCKEVTEKFGAVFGRKPEKNREIQEYIREGKILSVYDAGVKKYIWTSTSNNQ